VAPYRVDLRSDTVTTPSPAMRRARADAEVGDDWYGDDPTVNRLQERAAEVTGKEAALYVPTGTMANQIGLRLHFRGTGHLVVAEASAHVATTEVMSSAVLSGIAFRTLPGDARGQVTPEQVARGLEPDEYYDVEMIDLLAVENTHGTAGGRVMAIDDLRAFRKLAQERSIPLHLDGARIFNASVASGVDVAEYCAEVDTMMFCVSKGLGAPIGSLLCGPAALMPEARRIKILLGGAWRQAGITAAAGLVALRDGAGRLAEDHARARALADGLADLLPGSIDPASVETNMVLVDTEPAGMSALEAVRRLAGLGVGATIVGPLVRMVTHVDVTDDGVRTALAAWREALAA
jgi:threonine aldolase